MVESIEFLKDCGVYKKGELIKFNTGVNVIIGPQQCGKTSLLNSFAFENKNKVNIIGKYEIKCFNFQGLFSKTCERVKQEEDLILLEFNGGIFPAFPNEMVKERYYNKLILLDEPDQNLTNNFLNNFIGTMAVVESWGNQILITSHRKEVADFFRNVFDVPKREWIKCII